VAPKVNAAIDFPSGESPQSPIPYASDLWTDEFGRLLLKRRYFVRLADGRIKSIKVGKRRLIVVDSYRRMVEEALDTQCPATE